MPYGTPSTTLSHEWRLAMIGIWMSGLSATVCAWAASPTKQATAAETAVPAVQDKGKIDERAWAFYRKGKDLEKKGLEAEAAFAYKSALKIQPDFILAQRALTEVQLLIKEMRIQSTGVSPSAYPFRVNSAAPAARDVTDKVAPGSAQSRSAREKVASEIRAQVQRNIEGEEADDTLERGVQKHFLAGRRALDQREYLEAIREFELVLEFDPQHKQAAYNLQVARNQYAQELEAAQQKAKTAHAQGDRLGELQALRTVVKINPADPNAQAAFRAAALQNADAIEKLYKKGVMAYTQGKYNEAIQIWYEVLDLDPHHSKAQDSIQKAKEKLDLIDE